MAGSISCCCKRGLAGAAEIRVGPASHPELDGLQPSKLIHQLNSSDSQNLRWKNGDGKFFLYSGILGICYSSQNHSRALNVHSQKSPTKPGCIDAHYPPLTEVLKRGTYSKSLKVSQLTAQQQLCSFINTSNDVFTTTTMSRVISVQMCSEPASFTVLISA